MKAGAAPSAEKRTTKVTFEGLGNVTAQESPRSGRSDEAATAPSAAKASLASQAVSRPTNLLSSAELKQQLLTHSIHSVIEYLANEYCSALNNELKPLSKYRPCTHQQNCEEVARLVRHQIDELDGADGAKRLAIALSDVVRKSISLLMSILPVDVHFEASLSVRRRASQPAPSETMVGAEPVSAGSNELSFTSHSSGDHPEGPADGTTPTHTSLLACILPVNDAPIPVTPKAGTMHASALVSFGAQSIRPDDGVEPPLVVDRATLLKDEVGMKVLNQWTFLKELGRGAYGKVKLAVNDRNEMVAIKIVPHKNLRARPGPESAAATASDEAAGAAATAADIKREVAVMSKLRHKNVLRLREVIDDPEAKNIYLVMNYAERGPLVTMRPDGTCTPLQFDVARGYMRQLLNGLQYLHNHGVCHRDIKPDNILLGANGVVYFSDFGVSSFFRGAGDAFVQCEGTPAYHSPEIARGEAFAGPPADVWALGVAFYCMVYGRLPFRGDTPRDLRRAIVEDDVAFPELFGDEEQQLRDAEFSSSDDDRSSSRGNSSVMAASNASQSFNVSSMGWSAVQAEQIHQDVVNLLRRMLEKDPEKRITVRQCRRHPVVRDVMRGANQTRVGRLKSVSRGAHEKSSKQATGHRDSDELVTAEQVAESTPSRVVDGAETTFGINSASQLSLEAFSPLDMLFQRNEGPVASSPSRRVGGPLPPEQTAAAERFRRRHLDQHTPSSPSTDGHSSGSAASPSAEH